MIFARALVANAAVVILDEPTSSLDLKNQAFVLDKIRRLAAQEHTTIVFSTHQPQHAASAADHVLLMTSPDACHFGSTTEVLSEAALTALFGVALRKVIVSDEERTVSTFVPLL